MRWVDAFLAFAIVVLVLTGVSRYQPYSLAVIYTPSIPRGLYLSKEFSENEVVEYGDIVCWRHGELGKFIDRNYVHRDFKVCKPVEGLPGDKVTAEKATAAVHRTMGTLSVDVAAADSKGRSMPNALVNVAAVPAQTVVVIAAANVLSLDSRYLGPIPQSALKARLTPILQID